MNGKLLPKVWSTGTPGVRFVVEKLEGIESMILVISNGLQKKREGDAFLMITTHLD